MDAKQAKQVHCIRTVCARELGSPYEYPFFNMDYQPGESPNEALLRLFTAERRHHDSDLDAILVLCHG